MRVPSSKGGTREPTNQNRTKGLMGVDTTVYDLPEAERGLAAIAAQAAQWRKDADASTDQWTRETLTGKAETARELIAAGLRAIYPWDAEAHIAARAKGLDEATTLFTLTWDGVNGQRIRVGDRRRIELFGRLVKMALERGTARDVHVMDITGEDVTREFFPEVAA
jgi:hypothetical protein